MLRVREERISLSLALKTSSLLLLLLFLPPTISWPVWVGHYPERGGEGSNNYLCGRQLDGRGRPPRSLSKDNGEKRKKRKKKKKEEEERKKKKKKKKEEEEEEEEDEERKKEEEEEEEEKKDNARMSSSVNDMDWERGRRRREGHRWTQDRGSVRGARLWRRHPPREGGMEWQGGKKSVPYMRCCDLQEKNWEERRGEEKDGEKGMGAISSYRGSFRSSSSLLLFLLLLLLLLAPPAAVPFSLLAPESNA